MNQKEIYSKLKLQEPYIFRKNILEDKISNPNTFNDLSLLKDFIQERRTGKTTRKCIRAIEAAMAGHNVLYVTMNYGQLKSISKKIMNYLNNLEIVHSGQWKQYQNPNIKLLYKFGMNKVGWLGVIYLMPNYYVPEYTQGIEYDIIIKDLD